MLFRTFRLLEAQQAVHRDHQSAVLEIGASRWKRRTAFGVDNGPAPRERPILMAHDGGSVADAGPMGVYTINMPQLSSLEASQPPWVTLSCTCANVRRLARLATRLYDDEM